MIRNCKGCGTPIEIKDGRLCSRSPSTNRKGITCLKPAYRHQCTTWNSKGSQLEIFYLCYDCEAEIIEALGGK